MPLHPKDSPLQPPGRTRRPSKLAAGALSGLLFGGLLCAPFHRGGAPIAAGNR